MRVKHICAIFWLGLAMAASHADQLDGLSVYRGVDGHFGTASLQRLEILRQAAVSNGQITVWVSFDMKFESNPQLQTPDIARQEAVIKERIMHRVVRPLVAKRQVEILPLSVAQTSAPGCMLAVTAAGLAGLANSTDVNFIGYIYPGRSPDVVYSK